jgi:hypothetical protein
MLQPAKAMTLFGAIVVTSAIAAPVRADTMVDAQRSAGKADQAITAWAQALAAGDMAAIVIACLVLSGLVALLGIWLLVSRPRPSMFLLEDRVGENLPDPETAEVIAAAAPRPRRLLEAIAVAKAQMEISEAERKHVR